MGKRKREGGERGRKSYGTEGERERGGKRKMRKEGIVEVEKKNIKKME